MIQPRKEDLPFSGTHVGALIESLRKDISLLAEGQNELRDDVKVLKKDVSELKTDVAIVKDVIRIAIPDIYSRLTALESKAS